MSRIFEAMKDNPLWDGIGPNDLESMIRCTISKTKIYNRGDTVLLSGDAVNDIGLILSGGVKIIKEDADGNIAILAELFASELFCEVFICAGIDHSPVTVQASEISEIMFINYKKIITSCECTCGCHSKLIGNMLKILAQKNLLLHQKIEILSKRTTREKLLSFFDIYRGKAKKFSMPFNRMEMAQYLCVDRSAMSNELSKMRNEGLIKYKKSTFEII